MLDQLAERIGEGLAVGAGGDRWALAATKKTSG